MITVSHEVNQSNIVDDIRKSDLSLAKIEESHAQLATLFQEVKNLQRLMALSGLAPASRGPGARSSNRTKRPFAALRQQRAKAP